MANNSEWQEDQNLAFNNEQTRIAKLKAERDEILGGYTWVKVPRYYEKDPNDEAIDWKIEYQKLNEHHIKETEFLINKIREIIKR